MQGRRLRNRTGSAMSPSVAAVIALALGLPVVMFVAVFRSVGGNPELLTSALTFTVVTAAVVGLLFEIKRLTET
jgi:hypothetical protein